MKPQATPRTGSAGGVGLSLKKSFSYGPTIACITPHEVGLERHEALIPNRTDGA